MTQPLFVIEIHCIRPSSIDEAEQKWRRSEPRLRFFAPKGPEQTSPGHRPGKM
jgi:hypothetical protein